MTAKIHSDHAFILWNQQVGLLHVLLAIKQNLFFLYVCITVLLGLRGAWKNLLLCLEKALNFVLPKVYKP